VEVEVVVGVEVEEEKVIEEEVYMDAD